MPTTKTSNTLPNSASASCRSTPTLSTKNNDIIIDKMIINGGATSAETPSSAVQEHDTISSASRLKLTSISSTPHETLLLKHFEPRCFLSASSDSSSNTQQDTGGLRPWAVRKPKVDLADAMRASCRLQGVVGVDYLYGRVSAGQRKRESSGSIDVSSHRWLDSPLQDDVRMVRGHVSLDYVTRTARRQKKCRNENANDDETQGDSRSDVEFGDELPFCQQQLTPWPGKNHDTSVTISQEFRSDFDSESMILDTYLQPADLSSDFPSLAIASPNVLFKTPEAQDSRSYSSTLPVSRYRAPNMYPGDSYEYLYDEQGSFRLFIRGKEGGLCGDDGFLVDERAYA